MITLNNQPEMHLKLLQKEQFKRQLKLLVDLNGNKIAGKITKKNHHKILQGELKVKQKYQKKDIYISKRKVSSKKLMN